MFIIICPVKPFHCACGKERVETTPKPVNASVFIVIHMQSQAEAWKIEKQSFKKLIIDERYIKQRTLTKANCILMGIFTSVASSTEIRSD